MYSGYALYISVTIFCNSLPLKTYAAKTCESLGKNKKKFWKMNIIDDLQNNEPRRRIFNEGIIEGMSLALGVNVQNTFTEI